MSRSSSAGSSCPYRGCLRRRAGRKGFVGVRVPQRHMKTMMVPVLGALALALACGSIGCGGEVLNDDLSSDEGGDADAAPEALASCMAAECGALVGTRLSTTADGGVESLCGHPPNTDDAYDVWFDPAGNCVCRKDDAGTFTACSVVTRAACEAQTSCGSCNASPACAWCIGSTANPEPHCDFRPASECGAGRGALARPDCSD